MPYQISWQIFTLLGQIQSIHFINSSFNYSSNTSFLNTYKRCQQSLNKISDIYEFINKINANFIKKLIKITKEKHKEIIKQFNLVIMNKQIPGYLYVNEIEDEIQEIYQYLQKQKKQYENLKKQYNNLVQQLMLILTVKQSKLIQQFMNKTTNNNNKNRLSLQQQQPQPAAHRQIQNLKRKLQDHINMNNSQFVSSTSSLSSFQHKCYLIKSQSLPMINKTLFRISKGNICVENIQIPYDRIIKIIGKYEKRLQNVSIQSQQEILQYLQLNDYSIILVIYQKTKQQTLLRKINKFMSNSTQIIRQFIMCDKRSSSQQQQHSHTIESSLMKLQLRLKQLTLLSKLTQQSIQRYLYRLYECKQHSSISRLSYLQIYIRKQKQIYRQLSCCEVSQSFVHFEMFIPREMLQKVLNDNNLRPNKNLPPLMIYPKQSSQPPPTKFTQTQIMSIPQEILNTYGVPNHEQFNPAVLYIVTFGFFIGIMFGDIGHMLMVVPLMVYFNVNKWGWIVVGWMGYCGLVYNQFFGLNFGLFQSCYEINPANNNVLLKQHCVYPFGIDPVWKAAENQMQYINSYKMKLSVIIGVIHMLLGLLIKFINNIKSSHYSQLILSTLPQSIFMLSTFLYMDYLIILKWFQSYKYQGQNTSKAPSIISTMIAVYAEFGYDGNDGENGTPIFWEINDNFNRCLLLFVYQWYQLCYQGCRYMCMLREDLRRIHILKSKQNWMGLICMKRYNQSQGEINRKQPELTLKLKISQFENNNQKQLS